MKISFSSRKKNDAAIENHVRLPYGAAKRVFPQVRWLLILLIVGSPFLFLIGKIALDWLFITSPGTVFLEKRTINSLEAGTVEKLLYHQGDRVDPDTVLFRVKRRVPENRLEQIALLEAERDAAIKGATTENALPSKGVSDIAEEMQLVNQSVNYYEQVRNDTKWLVDKGAATRAELDAAENKFREAKASLAAMQAASVKTAVNMSTPAVNPTRITQLEQSIKALKTMNEGFFEIKASQKGKVSSLFVNDGQGLSVGDPLAAIVDTERVHILTYVDPKDYKKISVGTAAVVKIPGTGRKINAVVEQMPVIADTVPNGVSEKIYPASMRGIQVFLKVLEPLQEQETIEGLPVVVEW